jgi:hypothetical protein
MSAIARSANIHPGCMGIGILRKADKRDPVLYQVAFVMIELGKPDYMSLLVGFRSCGKEPR